MKVTIFLPLLAILLLVACGSDKSVDVNEGVDGQVCTQVITPAYDPDTGEAKDFPTPCDVPEGWISGIQPVIDITPPVITLLGDENVSILLGEHYLDKGAIAHDNVDGDLTSAMQIDNPVDSSIAGNYIVNYSVSDSSNNQSVITRSVIVNKPVKEYGLEGPFDVEKYTEKELGESTVYFPKSRTIENKKPLVLFAPGFNSSNPESYHSVLNFIASHGYVVIYAKDNYGSPQNLINRFERMLEPDNNILPYVDTSKIGVVGHSSGGGDTFRIMKHFTDFSYGENARFIMALDPYFAFDMTAEDMQSLPSNMNVVILQFGDNGQGTNASGNHTNATDPIIPLTEYSLLTSIDSEKKDYQVFPNATHGYPGGNRAYSDMQGMLHTLDALMDYSFNANEEAHSAALEVGSDTPYADGLQKREASTTDYNYQCTSQYVDLKIDYCLLDLEAGGI